jgi:NADH-quinone oxidoreductase subunit E
VAGQPPRKKAAVSDACGAGTVAADEFAPQIQQVLADIDRDLSHIIPALQAIQEHVGYLPPATFDLVAAHFGVPDSRVYGLATFYAQFYMTRQGDHRIKVCCGTACHVRGSTSITDAISRKLGIHSGETTPDYAFTLERVACLGSCALAPVVVINEKVHGQMTPKKMERAIDKCCGK